MTSRIGTLYVYLDDETVMSWFKARATGNRGKVEDGKKEYAKLILNDVKKDLTRLGFLGVEIKFNRKAGCSCGCSPGWEIKAADHKNFKVMHNIMCITPPADKKDLIKYHFSKGMLSRTATVIVQTFRRKRRSSEYHGGKWVRVMEPYSYKVENSYSANVLEALGVPKEQVIATTKDFIKG